MQSLTFVRSRQFTLFTFVIFTFFIAYYDVHYTNVLLSLDSIKRFNFSWASQENHQVEVQVPYENKSNQNNSPKNENVVNIRSSPSNVNVSQTSVPDKVIPLLINTKGCALPKTELYPSGFTMKKDYGTNCDFAKRIVTIDDTNEMLRLTAEGQDAAKGNQSACSVFTVNRVPLKDKFVNGQKMFEITTENPLDISDKELFATKCGPLINFDAHFPLKNKVQKKLDSWKKQETVQAKPLPISILLLGFDSVSRSHFHRSLPKTLPLLTQMGFIDFKGYQTIAPNTLDNFYAFLMGLTHMQVTNTCHRKFSSTFDACPAIWKLFSLNNYVTMYTEDGDQSFKWGGQTGFQNKPTDYYTHQMFTSVQDYRGKYYKQSKDDSCPSSMNNPQFLLNYTERFLRKFMRTPFFSLTWFAYPFHDNSYSLYGLDEKVEEFFQFINSKDAKPLRERTLIIFNSDHGERYGDFIHRGYKEGTIERSLPGLFIRLPENLLKQYPELNLTNTLKLNSERLTSGFDLHHTFLHLLKITNLTISKNREEGTKFKAVLDDRSSLFLPVSDLRTCSDLHISEGNCACLKSGKEKISTNKSRDVQNNSTVHNALVKFAICELNSIVNGSKYRDDCEVHILIGKAFVSWIVKEETDKFTDGFLRFVTQHMALFEVLLRVPYAKGTVDLEGITVVGSFNRINRYGDVSWCVPFETDEDKKMKEFCHCKKKEE